MTEQDFKALEEWQSSPDGELEAALYNVHTNLKHLEDAIRTRDGLKKLRAWREDLDELCERLQTVCYAARPRETMQAAE